MVRQFRKIYAGSDRQKVEIIRKFTDRLEGKINKVATEEKMDKLFRWLK